MKADSIKGRRGRFRFTLGNMLLLTAVIAVWIASNLASKKSDDLQRQKSVLLGLSRRLDVLDETEVQMATYPRVADDFTTWEVFVPKTDSFDLRFATGQLSDAGMPQAFDKFLLKPGRHRVTLRAVDGVDEGYHFTVFVDGQSVFDRRVGREWMPNGWSQSSGLNVPVGPDGTQLVSLQLQGRNYMPKPDLGPRGYFNGRSDDSVTSPGYRLWIDPTGQSYAPVSPFIGFRNQAHYRGVGLRDGLRFRAYPSKQYEWGLLRPASRTNDPVLTIIPEFYAGDEAMLSEQTESFARWRLRNEPQGKEALRWQHDPEQTAYSAFLHAELETAGAPEPVVEIRWDKDRPSDVGIRLADTPANATLTRWRLRIVGGETHLWRLLKVDDSTIDVRTKTGEGADASFVDPLPLPLNDQLGKPHVIAWESDVKKPLQLLTRSRNRSNPYSGIDLFQGLPLAFAANISKGLRPTVAIVRSRTLSDTPDIAIPGGPVISEIQIELNATTREWIWLRAESP